MLFRRACLSLLLALLLLALSGRQPAAQDVSSPSGGCRPASMRTQEVGCWILADDPIGRLTTSSVFWTLDVYPTRAASEADKGPRGTVFESLGKVWLMTMKIRSRSHPMEAVSPKSALYPSSLARTIRCNTWRGSSTRA